MECRRPSHCCYWFSIRKGALIIGFLNAFCSAVFFLGLIFWICFLDYQKLCVLGIPRPDFISIQHCIHVIYSHFIIECILYIISYFTSVTLILGIRRHISRCLIPYMLFHSFDIFCTIVLKTAIGTYLFIFQAYDQACWFIILGILRVIFNAYFLIIIYTAYRDIKLQELIMTTHSWDYLPDIKNNNSH